MGDGNPADDILSRIDAELDGVWGVLRSPTPHPGSCTLMRGFPCPSKEFSCGVIYPCTSAREKSADPTGGRAEKVPTLPSP